VSKTEQIVVNTGAVRSVKIARIITALELLVIAEFR
jgi:hypothetical protein